MSTQAKRRYSLEEYFEPESRGFESNLNLTFRLARNADFTSRIM
jgi:hypothetical protein